MSQEDILSNSKSSESISVSPVGTGADGPTIVDGCSLKRLGTYLKKHLFILRSFEEYIYLTCTYLLLLCCQVKVILNKLFFQIIPFDRHFYSMNLVY